MKNQKSIQIVLLALLLFVLGCNDYRDYVVANDSNEIIEVVIYYKYMPSNQYVPNIMSLEDFEENEIEWNDLAKENYKFDSENKLIKVRLNSKEVLSIDTIVANEPESPRGKLAPIGLEVIGKNGSIKIKGNQVSKVFKAKHRRWNLLQKNYPDYVFYYK